MLLFKKKPEEQVEQGGFIKRKIGCKRLMFFEGHKNQKGMPILI